jgi:glycosyltransferase involved in cell wall biosynthesis
MTGRVALIHDFLLDLRGAERVFAAMCDRWPEADLFTAVYDEEGTEGRFAHRNIHTSFLQGLRPTARTFRPLLPLYPHAVESFDLREYDTVISSSSAWAHGALVAPSAVHVCYCHNPFRYAWIEREATLAARHPLVRPALALLLHRWRQWDTLAAQRVDRYLANSNTTAARIRRYFGRESTVLFPPVEVDRFGPVGPDEVTDRYVVVAELMAHKRIDVAVEAFGALGRPLVVVGDGPEMRRLRRMAGPTVSFTGRVPDPEVARLLRTSRALVVTATEEFGIAAVEAQAAGRPVIALADGGALESVIEGTTGTFYARNEPEVLAEAVRSFDTEAIDPAACVASAARFGVGRFQAGLARTVQAARQDARAPRAPRQVPGGLLRSRSSAPSRRMGTPQAPPRG